MKQLTLLDATIGELPDPVRSFQRETAQERRWRLRQEAARERAAKSRQALAERAQNDPERTVVAEIDHDPRWARPHSGYRVETIRDPRLDGETAC